jgi:hypothetical protein
VVFINLSLGSVSYHMGVRFWKSPPDRNYLVIGLNFVEWVDLELVTRFWSVRSSQNQLQLSFSLLFKVKNLCSVCGGA